MTRLCFFISALLLCLTSCKSKDEISPAEVWSSGCSNFEVFERGYRLSGLCCAYIIIPKLKLYKNKSFSADADFYAYTGSGFSSQPIKISGSLSKDGKSLSLDYSVNNISSSIKLATGRTILLCDCFCD